MADLHSQKMKTKCIRCPSELPANSISKTCDTCKEKQAITREAKKEIVVKCNGKTQSGNPCNSKVSSDYGNKYCKLHKNAWLLEKDPPGTRRCNSRPSCGTKDKLKAILPADWPYMKCRHCLDHENETSKERRADVIKKNDKLEKKNSDKRICIKCRQEFNVDEMGVRSNGEISNKCKKDFDAQVAIENNRPDRDQTEYYKEYESRPERKQQKKE